VLIWDPTRKGGSRSASHGKFSFLSTLNHGGNPYGREVPGEPKGCNL